MTRRAGVSRRVIFRGQGEVTRRAGVSRRVIFRGQGEVGAKLKLDTDVRLALFNLDLLEISSYEFLIRVHRDQE